MRKELLRPDRSELTADDAFRFRHALIRDAAYEGLPKAERAQLHERFATWLERTAADRLTEYEEIVGYHLAQAHRYRKELGETGEVLDALGWRAGKHLHTAGKRALKNGDMRAATDLLQRAIASVAEEESERLWWELDLAEAMSQPDPASAYANLGSLRERAITASDERLAARARVEQLNLERNLNPVGHLERVLEESAGLAAVLTAAGDPVGLVGLHMALVGANEDQGRMAAARSEAALALEFATRSGDAGLQEMVAAQMLALAAEDGTAWADHVSQAEALLPTLRSRSAVLWVRETIAHCNFRLGRHAEGRRQITELVVEFRDLGQLTNAAYLEMNAASMALRDNDPTAALALARSATAHFQGIGDGGSVTFDVVTVIAPALVALHRPADALEALDTMTTDVGLLGPIEITSELIARSEALLRLGRPSEAGVLFASLSDSITEQRTYGFAPLLVRAARVAAELGKPVQARSLAEAGRRLGLEKNFALAVTMADRLLSELDA